LSRGTSHAAIARYSEVAGAPPPPNKDGMFSGPAPRADDDASGAEAGDFLGRDSEQFLKDRRVVLAEHGRRGPDLAGRVGELDRMGEDGHGPDPRVLGPRDEPARAEG